MKALLTLLLITVVTSLTAQMNPHDCYKNHYFQFSLTTLTTPLVKQPELSAEIGYTNPGMRNITISIGYKMFNSDTNKVSKTSPDRDITVEPVLRLMYKFPRLEDAKFVHTVHFTGSEHSTSLIYGIYLAPTPRDYAAVGLLLGPVIEWGTIRGKIGINILGFF